MWIFCGCHDKVAKTIILMISSHKSECALPLPRSSQSKGTQICLSALLNGEMESHTGCHCPWVGRQTRIGPRDSWVPGTALPPQVITNTIHQPQSAASPSPHCSVPPLFSWGAACWLWQQTPHSSKCLWLLSSMDACSLQRIGYIFFRKGYV